MALLEDVVLYDTRANQPAATAVGVGTIYYVTDENVTERSNGATWDDMSDAGSGVGLVDSDYGDITVSGSGTVMTIDNDAVTYAKMQNVSATSRILGRKTAAAGDTEECTLSEVLDFIGSAAQGDILYRDAAAWARLAAGTSGQFLKTQGAGANPVWAAASGGSGVMPAVVFRPAQNEPPSANYATLDTRNGHPCLDFDGSADEEAVFTGVLPASYAAGGLTVSTFWAFTSATSGTLGVQVAIERMDLSSLDIDADNFVAFNGADGTAPGTSGQIIKVDVTFTDGADMGSLAAGEMFRLKIRRDADGTVQTDDIATDAELLLVRVSET